MHLTSQAIRDGEKIPAECCFGKIDVTQHVALSGNCNPDLAWHDLPTGTRSLVVICHDPDVPSCGDDVNQAGRTVPASLPRVDFFHWVLVDLDPNGAPIAEGEFSDGVTAKGKSGPSGPRGSRQGVNDYAGWFAGDTSMGGNYFGYDGPCPPWNDTIKHRYVFTIYALDIARCPVEGHFTGADVRQAIAGHVLGHAALTGWYTLNPNLA
ncbi:YbhB/YbcL family Raf kinase inhibitor-like protein [Chitinivorax sp. B]|uniref:YbhB/YbcL family Raf kinase inhibitor-like protein n=1 Tax=Chitinivorax sp. B TaxID=2502235 RepID=UPI0010F7E440|nr:YbhB/YbcL family Raf kinase inhibitor-like protein [Chitinivorax sp. B]